MPWGQRAASSALEEPLTGGLPLATGQARSARARARRRRGAAGQALDAAAGSPEQQQPGTDVEAGSAPHPRADDTPSDDAHGPGQMQQVVVEGVGAEREQRCCAGAEPGGHPGDVLRGRALVDAAAAGPSHPIEIVSEGRAEGMAPHEPASISSEISEANEAGVPAMQSLVQPPSNEARSGARLAGGRCARSAQSPPPRGSR